MMMHNDHHYHANDFVFDDFDLVLKLTIHAYKQWYVVLIVELWAVDEVIDVVLDPVLAPVHVRAHDLVHVPDLVLGLGHVHDLVRALDHVLEKIDEVTIFDILMGNCHGMKSVHDDHDRMEIVVVDDHYD